MGLGEGKKAHGYKHHFCHPGQRIDQLRHSDKKQVIHITVLRRFPW